MKIILDGMGGDNAPYAVVEGAVLASKEIEHQILIIGKEELINEELKKYSYDGEKIKVVHAEEVISNDDAPVRAVRSKKNSSIVMGINMSKEAREISSFQREARELYLPEDFLSSAGYRE